MANKKDENMVKYKSLILNNFTIVAIFLFSHLFCENSSAQHYNYAFEHFTQEDGLSNNQVQSIFQDKRGILWFGTSQGISRFDGYKFNILQNNDSDSLTLRGNLVRCIYENKNGDLFVGTENGGLNVFNREKENFSHPFDLFPALNLSQRSVNCIEEDEENHLWLGTNQGILLYKNNGELIEIKPFEGDSKKKFDDSFVRAIALSGNGDIWLGTHQGVFIYDRKLNIVSPFELPLPASRNAEIWELLIDKAGRIWIGTYDNGAFLVSENKEIIDHIIPFPENERSRTVRAITPDANDNFWFGTRGGLFVYRIGEGIIATYRHEERENKSIVGNSVLDIFHDNKGDTWIGTRNGISFLVHSKQVFRNFRAMPNDNNYLNSSEVYAFMHSENGEIWIGTEDGGINIYNPQTRQFTYITHNPDDPNSISSDCIKAFMDDGKESVWVGTFRGGINIIDKKSKKIKRVYRSNPSVANSLKDNRVWDIIRDSDNNIWVATNSGLNLYNPQTDDFTRMSFLPDNTQVNWIREDSSGEFWLGLKDEMVIFSKKGEIINRFNEQSRAFLEDSEGRFWITTIDKGVAQYDKTIGVINYYGEKQGVANNQTLCILEDANRLLWISTTHGLTRFDPATDTFHTFSARDGLQNDQFNYGAAINLPDGSLLFGGVSGCNIFDPREVRVDDYQASVILTDLRIFNRSIPIEDGKKAILTKSITETESIVLPFSKNVITVEFAALNYVNRQFNLYSHYLQGFDKEWSDPSAGRSVTYTNLDPGDYTLYIRNYLPDGRGKSTSLNIKILPPYWKTWWFKILIVIAILGIVLALVMFVLMREKLKNEITIEKIKAKKLHEFDMMKLRFFTNISHEIRTPLTLILGPLEKLKNGKAKPGEEERMIEIMYRNASQLDRLINQILDFRKIETGNLTLEFANGELTTFFRDMVSSFNHLVEQKEIELNFICHTEQIFVKFDADKLSKIVNNLISNAIKYTEQGGKIDVTLSVADETSHEDTSDLQSKKVISIAVTDTGKGIEEKNLDKIFNRFFQPDSKGEVVGTGIGLALTKELVKLHGGKIFVESELGKGSTFTVLLPYVESSSDFWTEPVSNSAAATVSADDESQTETGQMGRRVLLIVEDNEDMRTFIRLHFESTFKIIEAANGEEGWKSALKYIPDIIISDVMMPAMDGHELLKKIKTDGRTSHIPVILLTALGSKEHKLEGLSTGADDYITKPFDVAILQTKVENIFSIRQSLKQKYLSEITLQPKNIMITLPEERFLKKAIEIVEENMADADFDIEQFAAQIGVSKTQLYRKLHALTDMTVKEFVRDIRLKRAAQLLLQQGMSISEVAYAVGFKDLSHFRKSFRQEFGMNASDYVKRGNEK